MELKSFSLLYSIYSLIFSAFSYIKDKNMIKGVFYSDDFKFILNSYLNTRFKNDWIGRIYGVINPNIDISGKIDFSNTIIELNDDLTNDDLFVQNWIYRQLNLMKNVLKIKDSSFFDYIGMEIEKVGPENQNNYLIIFDIVSRQDFVYALKHFLKVFFIDTIIILLIVFIVFNVF